MGGVCKKRSVRFLCGIKGQFTIFIILGIVIMFIFGFAFYARAKIIRSQVGSQADVQLKNYLANNAINQYVTTCLDAVVDEDILVASMQGGLLDDSMTPADEYVRYIKYHDPISNRDFNVSIVIDANTRCPDGSVSAENYLVTDSAGLYPYNCRYTYLKDLQAPYLSYDPTGHNKCNNSCVSNDFLKYSGFFGINNISMLCDSKGLNAPGIVSGANSISCDYYDYLNNSMQEQLEKKIRKDIKRCVNFTEILKRTPSNITNVSDPDARIQFYKGGFIVTLEYPFTITMRNRQPVTKMVEFSVQKDIPYKELYEYTYELANYEVKDVFFQAFRDKDKVMSKSPRRRGTNLYDSDYQVTLISGDENYKFINIIQVIDTQSSINGIPLTVNMAVRNRRPALDWIHNDMSTRYDLVAIENRTLAISPLGFDPDDELNLRYAYSGWLEQYTEYYNWSDDNCSNPSSFDYIIANCTKRDTRTPTKAWSESALFNSTRRNSSYGVTNADVGFHTVRVSVFDRQGLEDFQDVRILVFDLPVAKINGSNEYDDIPDTRASYEDIYLLSGAESTVGAIASTLNEPFSTFFWNDTTENFAVTKQIDANLVSKMLVLPNDSLIPPATVNIMNIVSYPFKRTPQHYAVHNITLTVTTQAGLSNINQYYVNVTQCLNHSSSIPSYPYDTLPPYNVGENNLSGHLRANHTCCWNNLSYKDPSNACFISVYYGLNKTFRNYLTATPQAPDVLHIDYQGTLADAHNWKYDNDIFKQTFARFCSGDRGNICNGSATETRIDSDRCADDNEMIDPAWQERFTKERCRGPAEGKISAFSDTMIYCTDYGSGKSFEKLSGTGTGVCTAAPQCSNGAKFFAYDHTITDAKYLCNGLCDGSGACNSADASSCECSTSCNDYLASDKKASADCNGLRYGELKDLETCSLGKTYLGDRCSGCMVEDIPDKCRFGGDCTASLECDTDSPNSIDPEHEDAGCNSECRYVTCSGGFKFDPSIADDGINGGCPETCYSNNQCIDGYYCDRDFSHICKDISTINCESITGADDSNICRHKLSAAYICSSGTCIIPEH